MNICIKINIDNGFKIVTVFFNLQSVLALIFKLYASQRKPKKKFLMAEPLRGGRKAGPLRKNNFFEALKMSEKNVAIKLEDIKITFLAASLSI